MRKYFNIFLLVFCSLFLFGFKVVDESKLTINPRYTVYENMSEEEKTTLNFIPDKYISYYNTDSRSVFSTRMGSSFGALPTKLDLRNYNGSNYLTGVKNQGSLGLCWAFSSNSALESNLLINGFKKFNFSENQPDYVSFELGDTNTFGQANSLSNMAKYWYLGYSPVEESTFGSYFTTKKNKSYDDIFNLENVPVTVDDVILFETLDTENLFSKYTVSNVKTHVKNYTDTIKTHIMENGAVVTGIYWYFFNTSKNIIYNPGGYDFNNYASTGHAVTIIGWDDNYDAGIKKNGVSLPGAWLAMNSWGNDYAYFYISYYDVDYPFNIMGIQKSELRDWDNAYHNYTHYNYNMTQNIEYYEYYLGASDEVLDSVKIYNYFEDYPKLTITAYDEKNTYTATAKKIQRGVTSFDFGDKKISGDKLYLTVSGGAESFYNLSVFTESATAEKKLYIYEKDTNSFKNKVGDELDFYIITKKIPTMTSYTVTVENAAGKDITGNFKVNKDTLASGYATFKLTLKSVVNSSVIYVKVTCDGVSDSYLYRISSDTTGHGTQSSPYLINEPFDLLLMEGSDAHFKLTQNIDLEFATNTANGMFYNKGNGWTPIDFMGHLDGNGYKISNLHSKSGGLFNDILEGSVTDLELENFTIDTENNGYVLASNIVMSELSIITVRNANVKADNYASGLIMDSLDSNISNIKLENVSVTGTSGDAYIVLDYSLSTGEWLLNNIFVDNPNLNTNTNDLVGTVHYNYDTKQSNPPKLNINNNLAYVKNTYSMVGDYVYYKYTNGTLVGEVTSYDEANIVDTGSKKITLTERNKSATFAEYPTTIWRFVSNKSMNILNHYTTTNTNISLSVDDMTVDGSYLLSEKSGITISSFKTKLNKVTNLTYNVYYPGGFLIEDNNEYVATGDYVEVCNESACKQYTVIIYGDVNKSGTVTVADVMMVSTHVIDGNIINDKITLLAGDVNFSDDISVSDVMKISSTVIGGN